MFKLFFLSASSLKLVSVTNLLRLPRFALKQSKRIISPKTTAFPGGSLAPSTKSAFTLVEIILGITVLTIVMVAITVLTLTSIQANAANVHRLSAYYLAQEGLEGFRNMRDSNWMQNHVWNEGGDRFWGKDFNKPGYYTLNYGDVDGSGSPWELSYFDLGEEAAREAGEIGVYHRYFYVEVPKNDNPDLMEVTAYVEWMDHSRPGLMQVSTEFTDWREGPL